MARAAAVQEIVGQRAGFDEQKLEGAPDFTVDMKELMEELMPEVVEGGIERPNGLTAAMAVASMQIGGAIVAALDAGFGEKKLVSGGRQRLRIIRHAPLCRQIHHEIQEELQAADKLIDRWRFRSTCWATWRRR